MNKSSVRVLLLSDTHGHVHPEILALARSADLVVHAGDIGDPCVLEQLGEEDCQVHAVLGNNDVAAKWPAGARSVLELLPMSEMVSLPGGDLAVEHGHRRNPVKKRHGLLRAAYPEARLVLYGHSHRQLIDDAQTPWVVNPGAAGRSRTYGGSGCVVLTAGTQEWRLEAFRFAL
jgi:putative phosphoesterase